MEENTNVFKSRSVWIKYAPQKGREADCQRFYNALRNAAENTASPVRAKLAAAGFIASTRGNPSNPLVYVDLGKNNSMNATDNPDLNRQLTLTSGEFTGVGFGVDQRFPNDDQKLQRLQQDCHYLKQIYADVIGNTDFPFSFDIVMGEERKDLPEAIQLKLDEFTAVLNNSNAPTIVPTVPTPAPTPAATPAAGPITSTPTIGATSTAGPEAQQGFHYYLDKHRDHVNARLASTNFRLEGYTLKHKTSGHTLDIADNGTMRAKQIEFSNDAKIEQKLFKDLQTMLKTYSALANKNCPMSAPLHLNLYEDGKLTAEQKKQFDAMKTRIGHRIAEELKNPEYDNIRNLVRYQGKIPSVAPASAVAPEAPPARPLADHERAAALKTNLSEMTVIEGKIQNAEDYGNKLLGVDPKATAFIFPGNDTHADKGLHDAKSGSGLGNVASFLGEAGIGTLSLPTIFTGKSTEPPEKVAHSEMAKLWEAAGRGFTLVLPVRNKDAHGDKFFNDAQRNAIENITHDATREPSFWGQTQTTFAPGTENLPKIYTEELGKLQKFIQDWNASPSNRSKLLNDLKAKDPDLHQAFENGLRIKIEDQAKLASKAASPATTATVATPKK